MYTTIHDLPDHQAIEPTRIEGFFDELLQSHENEIDEIVANSQARPSWDNLMLSLEALDVALNDAWAPISHLNSVVSNPDLRAAHDNSIKKITAYETRIGQSRPLYDAVRQLTEKTTFAALNPSQQKMVTDSLKAFQRNGVALNETDRKRFQELRAKLTELSSQFANNVLDATDAWTKHVTDIALLEGIPAPSVAVAKETAQRRDLAGYLLTLDMACYASTMTHCRNRALREEMYEAYATRASDQGPSAGEYDNSHIVVEMLNARTELAELVGFDNFAEYSIDPKMATSANEVKVFLDGLVSRAAPQARQEIERMREFARTEWGIDELEPWDLSFLTERMRESLYDVADAELKPYFPLNVVERGMFEVVGALFDVEIAAKDAPAAWHDDVRYFEITRRGETIARFYLDAFAREKKRGGAWMADCRSRRSIGNEMALPVAYLTCNFTPPTKGQPSLLTHTEVVTLFHEFGHGLHHMLTQQKYATLAGINGVEWDAVELPSQFMENWCWQEASLRKISSHFETGEALPKELLHRLIAAKNLNSGMAMLRQLEFGLLDIELHTQLKDFDPIATMRSIRSRTGMMPHKDYDRMPLGFGHIFAGGYAAGYYSYLWAEVLSADAFAAFEEEGLQNPQTSERFLREILEVGSSVKAIDMFKKFRGRAPQNDALLRHAGIQN
ncbi:MAG: M3 family metallopeptidase [Gammaproteobacteria bacterium]|nr:M3 family metallopeptidase [Gammaproteobacteria bacterium]